MGYVTALEERLDGLRRLHQTAVDTGNTKDAHTLEKAVLQLAERVMDLRTVVDD